MQLKKIIKYQNFNGILFKLMLIQRVNKQRNQLVFDILYSFTVSIEKSASDKEPSNSLHSMIYRQRLDKSAKSNTHLQIPQVVAIHYSTSPIRVQKILRKKRAFFSLSYSKRRKIEGQVRNMFYIDVEPPPFFWSGNAPK